MSSTDLIAAAERWSGKMFGCYALDGFPERPIAMFRLRDDAEAFVKGIDAVCDYIILETDTHGEFQNV